MNSISDISNNKNLNKNSFSNTNKNSNSSLFKICTDFFSKKDMMPMLSFKDIIVGTYFLFPFWAILLIIIGIIIII
jgi:hypothetical protein